MTEMAARRRLRDGWSPNRHTLVATIDGAWVRLELDTAPYPVGLTPRQARELARAIYRMAQRIDAELGEQQVIDLLRTEAKGCA